MRQPINETEMKILLDEEIAALDNLTRPTWKKHRSAMTPLPTAEGTTLWSVARADDQVIVYDYAAEQFATATVGPDGKLGKWIPYGASLRDALRHFPKQK